MEFISLFAGIPGLVQACVRGYRILVASKNIAKDAAILHAHLRIQEGRLIRIAHTWGLEIPESDGDVSIAVRQVPQGLVGKMELELAEMFSKLVKEVMDQIAAILTDSSKLISRYGLSPENDQHVSRLSALLKPVQRSRLSSPLRKLRWSVVDKAAFSQLITHLTGFNDALEQYVPPGQRLGLDFALTIQFAGIDNLDELEQLRAASGKYQDLQQILDLKTFRIKLEDPNTASAKALEKEVTLVSIPDSALSSPNQQRCLGKFRKEVVFGFKTVDVMIEWKAYDDRRDPKRKEVIVERVGALASLLNRAANAKNLNTLHCLGYFTDERSSRFGYILVLPEKTNDATAGSSGATPTTGPTSPSTLYSLLGEEKPSASVPELGSRISLALILARNLLQLHAAGWLHKGIRSENVLFFHDTTQPSGAPDISNPYLAGFEYSRPDTDMAITETLVTYSQTQDCYRHPATISAVGAANPVTSRFRREFDVYSLGCILLEIGLWRKLEEFWKDKYSQDPSMFRERLIHIWSKDLGRTCGKTYESVVRLCLGGGTQASDPDASTSEKHDLDAYYHNIICRLQSCSV
jgi:hypothetical protein